MVLGLLQMVLGLLQMVLGLLQMVLGLMTMVLRQLTLVLGMLMVLSRLYNIDLVISFNFLRRGFNQRNCQRRVSVNRRP